MGSETECSSRAPAAALVTLHDYEQLLQQLPVGIKVSVSTDDAPPPLIEDWPSDPDALPGADLGPPSAHGRGRLTYLATETERRAWEASPARTVLEVVCGALGAWLSAARGRPAQVQRWDEWHNAAWSTPVASWPTHPWMVACLVDVAATMREPPQAREAILTLIKLRELLAAWLRTGRPRRRQGRTAPVACLWHIVGWMFLLHSARWQLEQGAHNQQLARQRLVEAPPEVLRSLCAPGCPDHGAAVAGWLDFQLRLLCGTTQHEAVTYVLTGERGVYIGSTRQQARTAGRSQLAAPAQR